MTKSSGTLDKKAGFVNLTLIGLGRFWRDVNKYGPFPNSLKYPELSDRCWIWIGNIASNGYGTAVVDWHKVYAHRLSWMLHCGCVPGGVDVLHKCNVELCVNPNHLYLGDDFDNSSDRIASKSQPMGVMVKISKLNDEKVKEIKMRRLSGDILSDIAKDYGVGKACIWNVVVGKTWKHVK